MNNCNGYFLLDAMIGLSVFIFVVLSIVPQLTSIYEERLSVREKHFAISLCHNLLQHWLATDEEPVSTSIIGRYGTTFNVEWQTKPEQIEICVKWKGEHDRKDSICGQAK